MFPRSPYVQDLYDQLEGTNRVNPRHLPRYVRYDTEFGPYPEGLRRYRVRKPKWQKCLKGSSEIIFNPTKITLVSF